jgi:hypothetical protein
MDFGAMQQGGFIVILMRSAANRAIHGWKSSVAASGLRYAKDCGPAPKKHRAAIRDDRH